MPKLFNVLIGVEEVALGPVIRLLGRTPGVAKFDVLPEETSYAKHAKHANGAATGHANGAANGEAEKPRKPRYQGDTSGADRIIQLLRKKPMKSSALSDAFEKEGRSGGSAASLLFHAKKEGLIESKEDGYHLTKRGRDKARYV